MPTIDVLDSTISYLDHGAGTPIVFLHGNPTSSHVWRKVLRRFDRPARLLAPDLIGMGKSGKPPSDYRFGDHARYLDAWFDALGLDRAVLVGYDWGGSLAVDRAARHPDQVLGVAFFETVLRPMTWADLPDGGRERFQRFRIPGVGEELVLDQNVFIENSLERTMDSELTEDDRAVYTAPYPTRRSRLPILAWSRSMPMDGDPPDVQARVEAFDEWLATSPQTPKLLLTFSGHPSLMTGPETIEWCRENIAGLDVVACGTAGHAAAEDRPDEIAAALTSWTDRHGLLAAPREAPSVGAAGEVLRIDQFLVPDAAVAEFVAGAHRTHELLREQPGFRYDLLVEGERTGGTTRVLTLAAWADQAAFDAARAVVQEVQARTGTDPQATRTRLGITAELGVYTRAPEPALT